MRRVLVILAFLAVFSAGAQAAMTFTVTLTGSYAVTVGSIETIIDVFKATFDAGEGRTIGALVFDVGAAAADPNDPSDPNTYDSPFQVSYKYHRTVPPPHVDLDVMTPTADDIAGWGSPYEETDTHFLPAGISDWSPVVTLPTETNDGSISNPPYDPGGYKLGLGSLSVAISVPEAYRTRTMDVVQVGVIRGAIVYGKSGSADDLGAVTNEDFYVGVPEPATLSLLVVAIPIILRRRAGRR